MAQARASIFRDLKNQKRARTGFASRQARAAMRGQARIFYFFVI
jgi:hypothetical protein